MMEAKMPKQFLEEILPSKFKPEKAGDFDVIAQLNLTGPNGGSWVLTLKNQTLKVTEGTHPSPTLTLTVADTDFMDLVNGKLRTDAGFFQRENPSQRQPCFSLKAKGCGVAGFWSINEFSPL